MCLKKHALVHALFFSITFVDKEKDSPSCISPILDNIPVSYTNRDRIIVYCRSMAFELNVYCALVGLKIGIMYKLAHY